MRCRFSVGKRVAHGVRSAAMPWCSEHLRRRRLQTLVRVGDQQSFSGTSTLRQAAWELRPERFGLSRPAGKPQTGLGTHFMVYPPSSDLNHHQEDRPFSANLELPPDSLPPFRARFELPKSPFSKSHPLARYIPDRYIQTYSAQRATTVLRTASASAPAQNTGLPSAPSPTTSS